MAEGQLDARPELTAAQVKAIKSTILTEHFRFVPESFAKSCFDIANKCLYVASAWLEDELLNLVRQQHPRNDDAGPDAHTELEDEVQKGCYRLETLLEHGIDKNFDLFEIFMLRNTFSLDDSLIPYVQLPHQVNFDPSLKGSDQSTLDAYEDELRQYEREVENERRLKAVELFLGEKRLRLERVKEQIGWLGFGGERNPLPQRTTNLSPSIANLTKSIQTLLDTPSPASTTTASRNSNLGSNRRRQGRRRGGGGGNDRFEKNEEGDQDDDDDDDEEDLGVWNHSRTSFVNWVAGRQSSTIGAIRTTSNAAAVVTPASSSSSSLSTNALQSGASTTRKETKGGVGGSIAERGNEGAGIGTKQDAQALLSRLGAQ